MHEFAQTTPACSGGPLLPTLLRWHRSRPLEVPFAAMCSIWGPDLESQQQGNLRLTTSSLLLPC